MKISFLKKSTNLVKAVAETGLFDADWYCRTYDLSARRSKAALEEYVKEGAAAGRKPNAYFDAAAYGARTGIHDPVEALLHYAREGWRAGIDPSSAFLLKPYLARYLDLAVAGAEPLSHFLAYGRQEGRQPVGLGIAVPTGAALKSLVRRVAESPLFDEAYYLATYAHVLDEAARQTPARHYVETGETMGYRPNLYFDPAYYCAQLPAQTERPCGLFLHYGAEGWRQGFNPSAEFDTRLNQDCYGTADAKTDPLTVFLTAGKAAGQVAIPVELAIKEDEAECRAVMAAVAKTGLFDAAWYGRVNADLRGHTIGALEHYVRFGMTEGRQPNPYFDVKWYAKQYRSQIGRERPLVFYAREGFKLRHSPSAVFSAEVYFRLNPDLTPGKDDALKHYLSKGRAEGRVQPNPEGFTRDALSYLDLPEEDQKALRLKIAATGLFDVSWYRSEYAEHIHGGLDPIDHYLIFGSYANLDPNPYFDSDWYVRRHQVDVGDQNPLLYYAEDGVKLGHWPSPLFDPVAYVEANPNVREFQGSPLAHYLLYGRQEGRSVPEPDLAHDTSGAATFETANGSNLLTPALEGMIDFERANLQPHAHEIALDALDIHWVIPDFSAGGGGHMTIFRMIGHLERQGHRVTVWVNSPNQHKTPEEARETIRKHFQYVRADVHFVDPAFAKEARGDVIIATDCWSVWPVMAAADFVARFYFVQDFEPYFHPMGGKYLAAELTYRQDLFCICASPWLSARLHEVYGRETSHFWLAADQRLYKPLKNKPVNAVPRIAFYSRIATDRRAVELGLLALERLARRGVDFHVDFFGGDNTIKKAPFAFTDHGVATPDELAALFGKADIGVVFSATNYSLVPQEMMACGLPIVELDGESTRAIYPVDTVTWAGPDPVGIADAIEGLLTDEGTRTAQAKAALEWVSAFSWHKAAESVEAALQGQVRQAVETGRAPGCSLVSTPAAPKGGKPFASVVIPTYNAGPGLDAVLAAVCSQHAPWPYEVLVIDSGSTDETLDIVARHPMVRLHEIEKGTFNHGDTRNLGVKLTEGDYIAFLTHDALPANDAWLFNLVMAIEDMPGAAGAFGRHLAYPEASAFTRRDLDNHFALMARQPLVLSRNTDRRRQRVGVEGWQQILHFYSDNNSCMRRSVWERIPYRRVTFGEDQLWAKDIIEAGFEKVYAAQAVVYHSHDYDAAETQERSSIESSFFKHFFGYALIASEAELAETLASLNLDDEAWGRHHGVAPAETELRKTLNAARLRGYLEGYLADTGGIFEDAAS